MIILDAVDKTANFFSGMAPIPILGRAAGLVRVGLGLVQTIAALALAIFLSLPAIVIKDVRPVWSNCMNHTAQGVENIVLGTLEMIPFIGVMF